MRTSTLLAPIFLAATALSQAVEEGIAPDSPAPSGCKTTVDGKFRIGTLENPSLKRETAQEASDGDLLCTLKDGILHDQFNRTGSIVANHQFQFDGPPQAGAIYTGGFSVCANDSLAIGGSTRWWRCMSGAFGNLYDESIGGQCHEIRIQVIFDESTKSSSKVSGSMSSTASASASASASESLSTLSVSATSGANSTASTTSGASSGSATPTSSPSGSSGASASRSGAAGASSTGTADAPPANGASSLSAASLVLPVVLFGAALML